MAHRLEVRSAIVCILSLGIATALAAPAAAGRRPVAVVALADDPRAESFANLIGTTLVHHDTLAPLEPGSMIGALVGEFLDESRDKIASAEGIRVRAEGALDSFVFPVAIATAQVGHESLHTVVPTTHAIALYAELSLILGIAKLGEERGDEAARFFGLVHRLTPGRRLDPALHLPAVVGAFEAARTGQGGTGRLVVKGTGRLWIDGKDQGVTTRPFDLAEGLHVVWVTGPERETVGKQVWVEAGKDTVLDLGDAPAPLRVRVQRARLAMRNAADPAARGVAMRRLAELLAVHDAVVITMADGKLIVQTWHDKAEGELQPGFSPPRLAEGEKPLDLLSPLAPPVPQLDLRVRTPPVVEQPWYRRRGVQASIAAGVLGAIVGSVVIARSLGDQVELGRDLTFLPPKMAGQ
ncbi:MAG TPA: hypothetical protein VK932_18565 [Kofleriaceae bacterium]|nr:hypothetical protein [Kofleriaceae bacterium]